MKWQQIILAEWRNNDDAQYSDWLFCLVRGQPTGLLFAIICALLGLLGYRQTDVWRFRWWFFWWYNRPHPFLLEEALRHAPWNEWPSPLRRLEEKKRRYLSEPPNEGTDDQKTLVDDLQSGDWMERFAARHTLAHLGGEVVELLKDEGDAVSAWVLKCIAADTAVRLAPGLRFVCKQCLDRCIRHCVRTAGHGSLIYYGCGRCKQSRELHDCPGKVIAYLDSRREEEVLIQDGDVQVSFFKRGKAFIFDMVVIAEASDQQVESFVIQTASLAVVESLNGQQVETCLVSSECCLSKNTLNMLHHRLARVKRF